MLMLVNPSFFCFCFGKNTILVLTFWGHSQFGLCYFQVTINLVLTVNSLTENVMWQMVVLLAHT